MKKFFGLWMMAFVLCLFSCKNTDPVRVYENTAAQDIAGTYVGSWHALSTTGMDTTYIDTESQRCMVSFDVYKDSIGTVAFVYPRCDAVYWDKNLRGLTNVAHAGDDLTFNNDKTANGLGSAFFGRVDTEGNITMDISFSEIDEISWNMVLVSYHFEGKKQIE